MNLAQRLRAALAQVAEGEMGEKEKA
jgi:hypothetical protein